MSTDRNRIKFLQKYFLSDKLYTELLSASTSFALTVLFTGFMFRLYFLLLFSNGNIATSLSLLHFASALKFGAINDLRIILLITGIFFLPVLFIVQLLIHRTFSSATASRVTKIIFVASLVLIVFVLTGDLHYFQYFGSRYDLYFWDFWSDFETARIVLHSLSDEISIPRFIVELLLFSGITVSGFILLKSFLNEKFKVPRFFDNNPSSVLIIPLLFLLLLFYSIHNADVMMAQNRKSQISESFFLSSAARNSIVNIIQSYSNRQHFSSKKSILFKHKTISEENFLRTAKEVSTQSYVVKEKNTWSIKHKIVPSWQKILKRRPKKIILVVMESMPAWPLEVTDGNFNRKVLPNLSRLKDNGLYFARYFHQGGGTMRNLQAILFSVGFPMASASFARSTFAYNNFPDTLPKVMKRFGYEPVFCYGASYRWQNLYYFLPRIGFSRITGRLRDEMLARDIYGLNDENLFNEVINDLNHSKGKTFHFVLTLSNHAPYRIPESFTSRDVEIPASLKSQINSGKFFKKRFRIVQYADYALGRFIDSIEKEPWFKDTLVILTGDHHFRGVVKTDHRNIVDLRRVHLIFYSPHLLKKTDNISYAIASHYDLMPTLAALVSSDKETVTTWGKSLFQNNSSQVPAVSDFVYDGRYLFTRNRLFDTITGKYLSDTTGRSMQYRLKTFRNDFNQSGLHYLHHRNEGTRDDLK